MAELLALHTGKGVHPSRYEALLDRAKESLYGDLEVTGVRVEVVGDSQPRCRDSAERWLFLRRLERRLART